MGTQRGIVHFSGQFDDMQLSIDHGKALAKLSVPVSKDRIMKDENYDLFRKSMSEFGGASLAVDALSASFGELGLSFADRYMRSRLQTVARKAVKVGPGRNGQRSYEVLATKHLFKEFDLNRDDTFNSRMRVKPVVSVNPDRNTATLLVPAFNAVSGVVAAPKGTTHFRLCLAVGVVTDVVYGGADAGYAPAEPTLYKLTDLQYSALHPWDGLPNPGFQMTATITGLPVLPPTAGLAVSVGIEFFLMVNGFTDVKAEGNAMMLVEIY